MGNGKDFSVFIKSGHVLHCLTPFPKARIIMVYFSDSKCISQFSLTLLGDDDM